MKSRKYPKLNDKEWLEEQYFRQHKTLHQIATEIGCNYASAWQVFRDFGIAFKNSEERRSSHVVTRQDDSFVANYSVIIGSLLGDGSLKSANKTRDTCVPYFVKSNKNADHVRYVASLLFSDDVDRHVSPSHHRKEGAITSTVYTVRSLSHGCLMPLFREWYPPDNGYRKVIPSSLDIDETVLLHWFLDDGTLKQSGKNGAIVKFCSESFLLQDQQMICSLVNQKYNLGMTTCRSQGGTGWRIRIPAEQTERFWSIIGPPPVPSLAYKWGST